MLFHVMKHVTETMIFTTLSLVRLYLSCINSEKYDIAKSYIDAAFNRFLVSALLNNSQIIFFFCKNEFHIRCEMLEY